MSSCKAEEKCQLKAVAKTMAILIYVLTDSKSVHLVHIVIINTFCLLRALVVLTDSDLISGTNFRSCERLNTSRGINETTSGCNIRAIYECAMIEISYMVRVSELRN